tara:strand:+ start:771 stop:1520 length:750 start_codon:yes stop_codon:yes gene_type:complete
MAYIKLIESINTKVNVIYDDLLNLSIIINNNYTNYYSNLLNYKIDIFWYILLTKYLNDVNKIIIHTKKNKDILNDEIKELINTCRENINIDDVNEYLNNSSDDELYDILKLCVTFSINNVDITKFTKTLTFNIMKNSYDYDKLLLNKITYSNKGVDDDVIKDTTFIKNTNKVSEKHDTYNTDVVSYDIFNNYVNNYYSDFETDKEIEYNERTTVISQKENNEYNIYLIYALLHNKSKFIEQPIYNFLNL